MQSSENNHFIFKLNHTSDNIAIRGDNYNNQQVKGAVDTETNMVRIKNDTNKSSNNAIRSNNRSSLPLVDTLEQMSKEDNLNDSQIIYGHQPEFLQAHQTQPNVPLSSSSPAASTSSNAVNTSVVYSFRNAF